MNSAAGLVHPAGYGYDNQQAAWRGFPGPVADGGTAGIMVEAILFDLANTLLYFNDFDARKFFLEGAADTYGYLREQDVEIPAFKIYALAHMRAFRRRYIWSSVRRRDFDAMDVMVGVLRKLAIDVPARNQHILAWMWYRPVAQRASVEPGTHAMLESFRRRGIKMAIVSNTCAPACCLDRHLEREKLLEFFPTRVYSSHTFYRKPHPEIFRTALDELGVRPQQALFVGDLIRADIKGARRVGMKTVWKPVGPTRQPSRRNRPDHIIRKITDLPSVLTELLFTNNAPQAI